MKLAAAVRAAAPQAPAVALESLADVDPAIPALATAARAARLIGQCAHESIGFTRVTESLYYTTPERLMAVWPSRFRSLAAARPFLRNPEGLANSVYGGRMGNTRPDDGWRYRGRGWLQLTGRANYARYGRLLGVDLEGEPDLAIEPSIAWSIAAVYLETRRRAGRTALEWADLGNDEMVTRIVNGGLHGLGDRRQRTAAALMLLEGVLPTLRRGAEGAAVERLQGLLAAAGFAVGALDGDFGPKTEAAVRAFQRHAGLVADGIAGEKTWAALEALMP